MSAWTKTVRKQTVAAKENEFQQPYIETLRTHYWTGHFFFFLASLIALLTHFPLQPFYYYKFLQGVTVVWAIIIGLLILMQRNLYLADLRPARPWSWSGIVYAILSAATVVLLIAVTGGHESPFRLLTVLPVILCALHYGWRTSLLAAFLSVVPLVALDRAAGTETLTTMMGEDAFLFAVAATLGWLVGQVTDLNRQMARELAGDRAFLRSVLDSRPNGLVVFEDGNRITFANAAFNKMIGTEARGLSCWEVGDLGLTVEGDIGKILADTRSGAATRAVRGNLVRQGELRHLEVDFIPLPSDAPQGSALVTVRDVTAVTILGERQLQSNQVLEMLELAVVGVDVSGKVTLFSPAAERLLGLSREEALGLDEADLWRWAKFSPEDTSRLLQRATDNTLLAFGERYLLVNQSILRDAEGGCHGRIITINDVTERRRIENNLARAATLAVVGEMAAGVAHEIRNPLTGVRGFAQLLAERRPEEPIGNIQPYLQAIMEEIDRVNKLITDFLMLARPRQSVRRPVDLGDLGRATVDLARNEALLHGVDLRTNLAPVPAVSGDGEQLRQVILNLLSNAFAAAGQGGKVGLSTGATGGEVFLRVTDNGPGIPPEIRERVFDPFFTTKDQGTGLGLAICERIVREHGGRLEFECGPEGTSFTVWLPLDKQEQERLRT